MTNTCPRILVCAITAAMIAVLCVSAFSSPVASTVELRMSQRSENALAEFFHKIAEPPRRPTLMDRIVAEQMRLGLTTDNVLNINAMDVLDPVHYRAYQRTHTEQDYDGDMGAEYSDHMRDNGKGSRSASLGSFVQIAEALPKIAAPSIVPDEANENSEANRTLAYLGRDKAEE